MRSMRRPSVPGPSPCTRPRSGRSTTPPTTGRSSATRTATTSRRSATPHRPEESPRGGIVSLHIDPAQLARAASGLDDIVKGEYGRVAATLRRGFPLEAPGLGSLLGPQEAYYN